MRAAIYARVSTERQERQQTIDSQLDALRDWAKAANHELIDALQLVLHGWQYERDTLYPRHWGKSRGGDLRHRSDLQSSRRRQHHSGLPSNQPRASYLLSFRQMAINAVW
jgi:hypothetical protein